MLKTNESVDLGSAITVWAHYSLSFLLITIKNSDKNMGEINYLKTVKAKIAGGLRGEGVGVSFFFSLFLFSFILRAGPSFREVYATGS